VLVPIYLLHRYQLQAVGKLLGGQTFSYALRGDGQPATAPVVAGKQRQALDALLKTLDPALLRLPDSLLSQIPARPPGHPKTRETFQAYSGEIFDPLGPARSASSLTLTVLLHPARAARMNNSHARNNKLPGFTELNDALMQASWYSRQQSGLEAEIQRSTNQLVLEQLLRLSANDQAAPQVRAIALTTVRDLHSWLAKKLPREKNRDWRAHYAATQTLLSQYMRNPASVALPAVQVVPPGSPIGATVLTP